MKKIIDGKVEPEKYDNSSIRILWVLKEANVSPDDVEKEIDICEGFRSDWHIKNALSVPTFRRMIYATYGILNPQIEWVNVPFANAEAYGVIKQVAYININKYPAGSKSTYSAIKNAYNINKDEILGQIKYLNPDIIIFGNTLQYFEPIDLKSIGWDILESNKQYVEDTFNTAFYLVSKDKLCINAYHPSYPRITDKIYWYEIKKAVEIWDNMKKNVC